MNSDRATSISPGPKLEADPVQAGAEPPLTAAWLSAMLQANDSLFPTGSYAHSFGLEPLVQEGVVRDGETLRTFLHRAVLPGLAHLELPLIAHAWRALGAEDWNLVAELCFLSAASRPASELRTASENIGRQRAELAAMLRPDSCACEFVERAKAGGWPHAAPISAALEARVSGAPLSAALTAFSYASLAAIIAAAMKLLRLGQNRAQTLLTEALATVPELVAFAPKVAVDEIGWFNPWLDIAAARHETADARMFIS